MTCVASGHEVVPLEGDELCRQEKDFTGYADMGIVRFNPGSWLLVAPFTKFADKIYKFPVKSSDVYIVTWPKCGTTWCQEIVWTMRNNPNLDHPMAKLPVNARVPFLEFDMLLQSKLLKPPGPDDPMMQGFKKMCPGKDPADGLFFQMSEASPDPRTIKSHLPLSLLPTDMLKTSKVVYVARNPKDVVVSFHHHCKMFKNHNYTGSFEDFVQYFVNDDLLYGPYWLHLKEAWERRDEPNLHFIFYEDLKSNNIEELKKLNTFLGTNIADTQLEKISHYTSFNEMKTRADVVSSGSASNFMNVEVIEKDGGFFRKGKVGDWKGKYTPELEAKIDDWVKKNLQGFGINFKYVT
ncbi:sulfotransferase 1A1-like [Palaemon carinicauda]|uniref:sulfotransferase 1A1-like n=1 Tax=Palaemon carinicauda TaxID=392227 RepID=UPI0035B57F9F